MMRACILLTRLPLLLTMIPTLTLGFAACPSWAIPIAHSLEEQDSLFDAQTLGGCVSMIYTSDHHCNPAYLALKPRNGLTFELNLKSDEYGISTAQTLLFESLDQSDLDSWFRNREFLGFSGLGRVEALYAHVVLSHTPLYGVAFTRITNPSLPTLAAAAMKQRSTRLSAAYEVDKTMLPRWIKGFYLGGSLFHYSRTTYQIETNALEALIKESNALTKTYKDKGFDADFGVLVVSKHSWLPDFGMRGRNWFTRKELPESKIGLDLLVTQRLTLGLSKAFESDLGTFTWAMMAPYRSHSQQFVRDESGCAGSYLIGRLMAFVGYTPLASAFGFSFERGGYNVAIKYSNEKQDNRIDIERRNHVYLFTKFSL